MSQSWGQKEWNAYKAEHYAITRMARQIEVQKQAGMDVSKNIAHLEELTKEWEAKQSLARRQISEIEDPMMREIFERRYLQWQSDCRIEREMKGLGYNKWVKKRVKIYFAGMQRIKTLEGVDRAKLSHLLRAYNMNLRYAKSLSEEIEYFKGIRHNWRNKTYPRLERLLENLDNAVEKALMERAAAQALLDSCNPEDRELLYLHYIDGYSQEELAQKAGVSTHAVMSRLERARERLRKTETWGKIKADLDLTLY